MLASACLDGIFLPSYFPRTLLPSIYHVDALYQSDISLLTALPPHTDWRLTMTMTIVPPVPIEIARMTCGDLAECLSDIPMSLASALAAPGHTPISDVWRHLGVSARTAIVRAAAAEEARCAELARAVGL